MLLVDIYQCAQTGGGSLVAVFPGDITQSECKSMISYLTQNRNGCSLKLVFLTVPRLATNMVGN
jgi:hypothetical protein